MDERLSDELDSLEAILMDEVSITRDGVGGADVEITVLPATASDSSSQYVRATILAKLDPGYPDLPPKITLKNPRGLDDSLIKKIESEMQDKVESMCGEPILFEILETVRDHLTESNVPSCHCVICLYGFNDNDQFIKTNCYHYFHSHCLWGHVLASERIFREEQEKLPTWQRTNNFQRICPVCREVLTIDIDSLANAAPPVDRENARNFELSDELRKLQEKMAKLYQHQQSRGGIIDPEADDCKFLLVTEPVNETPAGAGSSDQVDGAEAVPLVESRVNEPTRGRPTNRGAWKKNRGRPFTAMR